MAKGHEALNRAACLDDLEQIASADPALANVVDDAGKTPLFYALYRSGATTDDDPSTVDALLKLGADPNQPVERKDGSLRSPLHQAAIRSLSRVARALVDAGADIFEPGLMQAAAEGGLTRLVARCLEETPVDQRHRGVTALHDACYSGTPELVDLLLERGADASARVEGGDWHGVDNLKFGIIGNSPVVVERMLAAGVAPTLEHLRFALDASRAWAPPREELEDALLDLLEVEITPWAEGAPFRDVVRVLSDALGDAAACRAVALEVAEQHAGATIEEAWLGPDAPRRARFWAEMFDVPVPERGRAGPISAPEKPSDATDEYGSLELSVPQLRAALHDAAKAGDADTLRAICRHADPNLACAGGLNSLSAPPLYVAAKNGRAEAVRALLECGADPLRTAADNKTAYQVAEVEVRMILREFGPVWATA